MIYGESPVLSPLSFAAILRIAKPPPDQEGAQLADKAVSPMDLEWGLRPQTPAGDIVPRPHYIVKTMYLFDFYQKRDSKGILSLWRAWAEPITNHRAAIPISAVSPMDSKWGLCPQTPLYSKNGVFTKFTPKRDSKGILSLWRAWAEPITNHRAAIPISARNACSYSGSRISGASSEKRIRRVSSSA